jgi:hypothetical protein
MTARLAMATKIAVIVTDAVASIVILVKAKAVSIAKNATKDMLIVIAIMVVLSAKNAMALDAMTKAMNVSIVKAAILLAKNAVATAM